jgi:hypothetical protein
MQFCNISIILDKNNKKPVCATYGTICSKGLSFIMKILKLYAAFNDHEIKNRYSYYAPDVYRRTNGYDCGDFSVYVW